MDAILFRKIKKLEYKDPEKILIQYRQIEFELADLEIPKGIRNFKTRELDSFREIREACLFCYFIGQNIGAKVSFAYGEGSDYDFIARWIVNNEYNYVPVQLKEVTESATFSTVVKSLEKYVPPVNLIVAIHLSKQAKFDPRALKVPKLNIAQLWVFGATGPNQTSWSLWGDLLQIPTCSQHQYPVSN